MRKERKLALTVVVLVLLGVGFILLRDDPLPIAQCAVRLHAERGSVDCGDIQSREGATAGDEAVRCVQSAIQQRRPFHVVLTNHGVDTTIVDALVGKSDGRAIELFYGTGMVTQAHELFKNVCDVPLKLLVKSQESFSGFPSLHCAPWPPPRLRHDFLLW